MGESGATGKKSVSHKLPGEKRKTGPWLGKLFLPSFAGAPKDFEGECGGESRFLFFFPSGFVIFLRGVFAIFFAIENYFSVGVLNL